MREYRLDDAETALKDYFEARRRREQPMGISGRLEEWTPDETEGPDGTYEHLVGLVRHVPPEHLRILELYYYGATRPKAPPRLASVSLDDFRAQEPTAAELAAHLGPPWTAADVAHVRRRAIKTVETALLDRLCQGIKDEDETKAATPRAKRRRA